MEINPNRPIRPISKTERKSKIAPQGNRIEETDETSFLGSELLSVIEHGLESMPEIRQERLQSGKELASDPNYPGEADLDDLAKLALKNLDPESEPEDEP